MAWDVSHVASLLVMRNVRDTRALFITNTNLLFFIQRSSDGGEAFFFFFMSCSFCFTSAC